MMFNKNSSLVKNVWVPLVLSGIYTVEQVPELGNLRQIVIEIVSELN